MNFSSRLVVAFGFCFQENVLENVKLLEPIMMEASPSLVHAVDITPVMENQKVKENETEAWMLR